MEADSLCIAAPIEKMFILKRFSYFRLSATATATATVAPTIGLLPIGNSRFYLLLPQIKVGIIQ